MTFDYYYGKESEQFSFYRVPRLLIKDKQFKNISSDAKLLYGLMLDRMSLSMKNGWYDDENRAYIIYSINNIMEDLGCSKPTCVKILKELDSETGIGLIEKIRRGFGKPDIIYVKRFDSIESTAESTTDKISNTHEVSNDETVIVDNSTSIVDNLSSNVDNSANDVDNSSNVKRLNNLTSRSKDFLLQEVKNFNFKKSNNLTSRGKNSLLQEVKNFNPNYTEYSYTDKSYTDMNYTEDSYNNFFQDGNNIHHINQSKERTDRIDGLDSLLEKVKGNIDYENHMQYDKPSDKKLYNELFKIICDVLSSNKERLRVGGQDCPYEAVKSRFLELTDLHLQYVISCMKNNTSKIKNIKAYMITALYNAPTTVNHYYQQEVQHDMFGSV